MCGAQQGHESQQHSKASRAQFGAVSLSTGSPGAGSRWRFPGGLGSRNRGKSRRKQPMDGVPGWGGARRPGAPDPVPEGSPACKSSLVPGWKAFSAPGKASVAIMASPSVVRLLSLALQEGPTPSQGRFGLVSREGRESPPHGAESPGGEKRPPVLRRRQPARGLHGPSGGEVGVEVLLLPSKRTV